MKKNIGEFSWRWFVFSVIVCLVPAACVYHQFPFHKSAPKTDVTPALVDMQRQLDDVKRKCEVQTPPVIKMPTAENDKSGKKR